MTDSLFDFPELHINKKIRLIELFGGIGSQAMALRDIGADFEHYKLVEFDKYAVASYNAIHGTRHTTHDIRQIHAQDLEIKDKDKYCYLMTYSFPCFTGDMLVLTKDGLKQIKNISTDDYVLTHKNDYQKVIASRKTGEKQIYKIKGMAIDELRCTENHRFYVRKMTRHYPTENGRRKRIRTFEYPEWIECKNLNKNYYLGIAINQNSIIPEWQGVDFTWADGRKTRHKNELSKLMSNNSFWWIIGRYLGDGWIRQQGGIIICCAKDETIEILPHLRNCNFNYSISEEKTVNKIHIALKELQMFVEQFGKGAKNKKLPGFIFDMPCDLLQSLFLGYASADGYVHKGLIKVSSISRELIYGFAQVVAKAYKTPYRIYKNKRNPMVIIEGRKCHQQDGFELVFKTEKKKQDKAFYENGFIWFPIQSVENTKQIKEVYDIETENAHSFTVNGVIVHNCTDLSVAGKMQGMSKADWESGNSTRSGLLWEVERILKECKQEELPDVLLMENVPQVHAEANRADFDSWLNFLKSKGYWNFWKDLNAKDYGIPQNRDRCFCVSILSPEFIDYEFPEGVKLEKVMKDFLEEEVDEKYYINTEKAKKLIDDLISRGELKDFKSDKLCASQSKSIDGKFLSYDELTLKNIGKTIANGITARVYKGFGGDNDNAVIEKQKEVKIIGQMDNTIDHTFESANRVYDKEQLCPIIPTCAGGNIQPKIIEEKKIQKVGQISNDGSQCGTVVSEKGLFPTISAGTHGYANAHIVTHYRIRKLTPKECWRLMGYTDKDFEKAAEVNSNTQLYRESGNAIVKQVMMAIFLQMGIKGLKKWEERSEEEKAELIRG